MDADKDFGGFTEDEVNDALKWKDENEIEPKFNEPINEPKFNEPLILQKRIVINEDDINNYLSIIITDIGLAYSTTILLSLLFDYIEFPVYISIIIYETIYVYDLFYKPGGSIINHLIFGAWDTIAIIFGFHNITFIFIRRFIVQMLDKYFILKTYNKLDPCLIDIYKHNHPI